VRNEKEKIAKTIEHLLGYYYIQRLESMIPPLILRPKPHELILDLCAAPGSKTTQLAQLMCNSGRIIANDIATKRLKALAGNVERLGILNVSITQFDARKFPEITKFNKILVDVPCSAEGRSFKERPLWVSKKLAVKQRKILERAIEIAQSRATIIYSTCTLSPLENEAVVNYVLKKFDDVKVERVKLRGVKFVKGVKAWQGKEFDKEVCKCARFYPHISKTGGFFVAKLRKL
jgi:NOL1/NOP2/sun family putative RNA methylase